MLKRFLTVAIFIAVLKVSISSELKMFRNYDVFWIVLISKLQYTSIFKKAYIKHFRMLKDMGAFSIPHLEPQCGEWDMIILQITMTIKDFVVGRTTKLLKEANVAFVGKIFRDLL